MNKSLVLKNKFYFYLSFLFTFFLFVYLLYFLVNGERGLLKYFSLKNLNAQYNEQYMSLKKENEFYLDRIKRLQPNTIDLDYLDETFRKVTGFTSDNETVIIALPSSSDGLDAEALPPLMFTAEKFKVGFVSSLLI